MEAKHQQRHMFLFFIALVAFFMSASFAHPVTPTLIQEYHLNDSMFGVALAAMQTTNFCFLLSGANSTATFPAGNLC